MPTSVWYRGVANSEALESATHGRDPLLFISGVTFCLLPFSEPWCLSLDSRGSNDSFVQDGEQRGPGLLAVLWPTPLQTQVMFSLHTFS